jgi:hypothetical protein
MWRTSSTCRRMWRADGADADDCNAGAAMGIAAPKSEGDEAELFLQPLLAPLDALGRPPLAATDLLRACTLEAPLPQVVRCLHHLHTWHERTRT